jgi:hypothetical protein
VTNLEFQEALKTFPDYWPVVVPGWPAPYDLAQKPVAIYLAKLDPTRELGPGYEESKGKDSFPAVLIRCAG